MLLRTDHVRILPKGFLCNICNKHLNFPNVAVSHSHLHTIRSVHDARLPFYVSELMIRGYLSAELRCHFCFQLFGNQVQAVVHILFRHLTHMRKLANQTNAELDHLTGKVHCKVCNLSFRCILPYVKHACVDSALSVKQEVHRSPDGYIHCPECSKIFAFPSKFLLHCKSHSRDKQCTVCQKTFGSQRAKLIHCTKMNHKA
jgi:hypothetical protein